MKIGYILILILAVALQVYSENITNTLGAGGLFKIKVASNDYLTLNQSTGQVNILRTLQLENTTNSAVGVIYKGSDRLLHNYGTNSTFLGTGSGNFSMTGNSNSGLGYYSLSNNTTGSNNTAIGYNTQVPSGTSSNQVRIGSTAITYAGVQVAWTITSDRKWKENINPIKLGLDFITKLNPVSYIRLPDGKAGKNDESKKTEYGLIAQEVEEVLKQEGVENSGMITVTDEGNYELRYNDLLAPMIKAIQELNEENEMIKECLEKFEEIQNSLVKQIDKLESKDQILKATFVQAEENN